MFNSFAEHFEAAYLSVLVGIAPRKPSPVYRPFLCHCNWISQKSRHEKETAPFRQLHSWWVCLWFAGRSSFDLFSKGRPGVEPRHLALTLQRPSSKAQSSERISTTSWYPVDFWANQLGVNQQLDLWSTGTEGWTISVENNPRYGRNGKDWYDRAKKGPPSLERKYLWKWTSKKWESHGIVFW